jgi:predicted nucleic-acid-binding protein
VSNRRLLDTNLIVRHLVQDNERHARIAGRIFAACDRGDLVLVVLPSVVAECVFVLESFYELPRADIARVMAALISSPGVELAELAIHLDALDRYRRTHVHFVDCTVAAAAASLSLRVATFDNDYKKFPDVTVDLGENDGSGQGGHVVP